MKPNTPNTPKCPGCTKPLSKLPHWWAWKCVPCKRKYEICACGSKACKRQPVVVR